MLIQKDPSQATLYVFGEQIVLTTSSGAVSGTRFIQLPGGGQVVRTGTGSNYNFQINNQQGTAVLTLNDNAQAPAWQQYTPYGAPRGTAPSYWPDTNGFLGKATDANTGLTTVGARQYDPSTGMFISVDPLLETMSPSQLNGYSYAGDNPVTHSDPSGEMLCMAGGICASLQYFLAHPSVGDSSGGGVSSSAPAATPAPAYYGGGVLRPVWLSWVHPTAAPRRRRWLAPAWLAEQRTPRGGPLPGA